MIKTLYRWHKHLMMIKGSNDWHVWRTRGSPGKETKNKTTCPETLLFWTNTLNKDLVKSNSANFTLSLNVHSTLLFICLMLFCFMCFLIFSHLKRSRNKESHFDIRWCTMKTNSKLLRNLCWNVHIIRRVEIKMEMSVFFL